MKANLIMIALVALCAGCANKEIRTDEVSGPPTHLVPGDYMDRPDGSSEYGDLIRISAEQSISYIPAHWYGSPSGDGLYSGGIKGNRIVLFIKGADGNPDGPDWKPSPATTSSFEILESSESKLVLRPLDSKVKDEGAVVIFEKFELE